MYITPMHIIAYMCYYICVLTYIICRYRYMHEHINIHTHALAIYTNIYIFV